MSAPSLEGQEAVVGGSPGRGWGSKWTVAARETRRGSRVQPSELGPPQAPPLPAHPPRSPGGGPPLPGDARPWHLLEAAPWPLPLQERALWEGSCACGPSSLLPLQPPIWSCLPLLGRWLPRLCPPPASRQRPAPDSGQDPSPLHSHCPLFCCLGLLLNSYPRPRTRRAPGVQALMLAGGGHRRSGLPTTPPSLELPGRARQTPTSHPNTRMLRVSCPDGNRGPQAPVEGHL